MSEYEQVIDEIVKHGVVVKVNKIVDDNYIPYERKYVGCVVELDFSEHDKPFEDKIANLEKQIEYMKSKKEYLRTRCMEDAMDAFDRGSYGALTIIGRRVDVEMENAELRQRIAELESEGTETCSKEPISDDCRPSTDWYENRYQQDWSRYDT